VERVIGNDVGKTRLDVYCLEGGRRLAVGNDAVGVAALVDQFGLGARGSGGHGGLGRLRAQGPSLLE
jgi:hypothetical protein